MRGAWWTEIDLPADRHLPAKLPAQAGASGLDRAHLVGAVPGGGRGGCGDLIAGVERITSML
ncbi:MAG: hypothetical protein U0521_16585 [Anaerolineae bacterium]